MTEHEGGIGASDEMLNCSQKTIGPFFTRTSQRLIVYF